MPLNYSIVLLGNPRKPDDPKKAYARSQVSKELTLKGLSQRVAAQTTVSRADVSAVLISVVENMIEALRDGEQVDFGELGKFRLQATSRGADSAEVFTATNITGVNIQFVPGDDLKKIFNGMSFNPVPSVHPYVPYSVPRKQARRRSTCRRNRTKEAGAEAKMTGRENFKQLIIDN